MEDRGVGPLARGVGNLSGNLHPPFKPDAKTEETRAH